jgi:hypothetical protein
MNFIMSQMLTFIFIGLAVAGVLKLFQLSTDLSEIKDLLTDIKRNSMSALPPRIEPALASPADLMRAVNAEGMDAAEAYAQSLLKPPGSPER